MSIETKILEEVDLSNIEYIKTLNALILTKESRSEDFWRQVEQKFVDFYSLKTEFDFTYKMSLFEINSYCKIAVN